MKEFHSEIEIKAKLIPDHRFSASILQRFIGMRSKDQVSFLNDPLAERDGPSLAAILLAPKAATGLSREHADRIWTAYTKIKAPEATAALTEYSEIEDATFAAIKTANRAVEEMNDPREVDRILAEQELAKQAEFRLNEVTN